MMKKIILSLWEYHIASVPPSSVCAALSVASCLWDEQRYLVWSLYCAQKPESGHALQEVHSFLLAFHFVLTPCPSEKRGGNVITVNWRETWLGFSSEQQEKGKDWGRREMGYVDWWYYISSKLGLTFCLWLCFVAIHLAFISHWPAAWKC